MQTNTDVSFAHNITAWIVTPTSRMNLRQIEVFRAIMLAGSVSGAARLLHVSQPGISRMLAHIELQLGVRLFERSRGGLRPTPEAGALYREVEQVYRGVSRIEVCAQGLKMGAGLSLRILASPSTAHEVVPRAVASVATQFPDARIYLETQLAKDMTAQLTRQDADIAISTIDIGTPVLHAEEVGAWSLVCVFPQGHPLERRRILTLHDIVPYPLITFSSDTPQGQFINHWCAENAVSLHSRLEVRSGHAACALAASGAGISIVDNLTARAWLLNGLRMKPVCNGPRFNIHAVRHAGVAPAVLTTAFVRAVRAGLKGIQPHATG